MISRSHALSGATVWLAGCAGAGPLLGLHPSPVTVAAGTAVAAGAAILPDIDHPSSAVARAVGPVSRLLARGVSWVSDTVRDATCGCCRTAGSHGHRTLTHTAVVAVASGAGLCLAGWLWGVGLAAWIVGAGTGIAALGLLPRARRGDRATRWLTAVMAGTTAGLAVWWLGGGLGWWWLGVPVGGGMLTHVAGDAITHHGVPMWWPLRIRGCRWARVGTPEWMRFRTGGRVETWLVVPSLVVVGVTAAAALVWGSVAAALGG